jgi:hypothetical protein
MNCCQPKCKNKAYYNYEKNGSAYCEKHKKHGMLQIENECVIL